MLAVDTIANSSYPKIDIHENPTLYPVNTYFHDSRIHPCCYLIKWTVTSVVKDIFR